MKHIHFIAPSNWEFRDLGALLLQEWRLCRGSVASLAMVWFVGLWGLAIFDHPGWLLTIGMVYVMKISGVQGGRDVIDGSEEFSFTLPPGRGPLFLARLYPGFVFLTINGLIGGFAIEYSLPQRLWSLVFSSGLTDPFPPVENVVWFFAALFVPCAAHANVFTAAALSGSRPAVNAAVAIGLVVTGAIMLASWQTEKMVMASAESTGYFMGLALLCVAVVVPFIGYRFYLRKETCFVSAGGMKTLVWAIAAVVAVVIFSVGCWFALEANGISLNQPDQRRSFALDDTPPLPAGGGMS